MKKVTYSSNKDFNVRTNFERDCDICIPIKECLTFLHCVFYREKEQHELTYLDNYAPYGLYQRIPTHGGRDFEYFTHDGHHYLVACNEYTKKVIYTASYQSEYETDYTIDSVIYWWTGLFPHL